MSAGASPSRTERLRGDGVLLLITTVWGLSFVVVKDALALADPMSFLTARFTVGAVVAVIAARKALRARVPWREGLLLGTLLFVGYAFQTFGLKTTTPSRSAFITGLCVVLVPFISAAVFRRWPPAFAFVGAVLAAIGLAVLTGFDVSAAVPVGDVLTLGCAISYAFHILMTERFSAKNHAVALVAVQLVVVAGLSACSVAFVERRFEASPALWGGIVTTGVFATAMAISLQTWAQAKTTAVRAAVIFALEPLFTIAWGVLIGRGGVSVHEWVGGGLIIGGVAVASAMPTRQVVD